MDSEEFKDNCMKAYYIYLNRLSDQTLQDRTKWAAEAIFQYLQSRTPLILEKSKRRELHSMFYSENVLGVLLNTFAGGFNKEKRNSELGALIEAIDKDWELIFLVNYYLREEDYTSIPWADFKKYILSWGKED
jgi:hypothetical protein